MLPGAKASDKICETELNEMLLNSMPNSWIRQAYVQGFNCKNITKNMQTYLNAWK